MLCATLPRVFDGVRMQVLALAGHSFSSSMPPSWTSMQKLRVLDVSRNQLSGALPQTYANLWQLAIA
jgi:hypothetical protein